MITWKLIFLTLRLTGQRSCYSHPMFYTICHQNCRLYHLFLSAPLFSDQKAPKRLQLRESWSFLHFDLQAKGLGISILSLNLCIISTADSVSVMFGVSGYSSASPTSVIIPDSTSVNNFMVLPLLFAVACNRDIFSIGSIRLFISLLSCSLKILSEYSYRRCLSYFFFMLYIRQLLS